MMYTEEQWKTRWPNFKPSDFVCSCCSREGIKEATLDMIQAVRNEVGPIYPTSGYRCEQHPEEAAKIAKGKKPGEHTLGLAVDVRCGSNEAMRIAFAAMRYGVRRVGVAQNERVGRFLHLGLATPEQGFPVALYSY